jgi:outer membrane protein assembly factor BamE (lipoprotein component of BamABCDE complex)
VSLLQAMKRLLVGLVAMAALAVVVHVYSLEGLDGLLFAKTVHEDTIYAPGYSDAAFRKVHRSMTEADVLRVLPAPIAEVWIYRDDGPRLASVEFAGNVVEDVRVDGLPLMNRVRTGMTKEQVIAAVGASPAKNLIYTRSKNDSSYHVRVIELRNGKVAERISEFYVD